jgi:uncharacterized membrane protein YgdD (TMEM256/DUF423 family)
LPSPPSLHGFASLGAISAFFAVAAGAFGAHALRDSLPADRLQVFETAARYQMYHALALLVVGLATFGAGASAAQWAGRLFVAGTILFSGSLYILALSGVRVWGAVTPFGGVAWLAAWAALALAVARAGR